ncbi:DUF4424 domain-containing protein [Brevundimonas sp.]|uniref:DUF4424 domain-containing protein n=1 Tax=Brevundimonas sp. TaxID=1871086 RepID=UPI002D5A8D71|nr:DUF4424 domain-containing protein [Brevundimonas sp.]HYC69083.1 DUF4424 domain-containing protein [Brevundimonas sp.]
MIRKTALAALAAACLAAPAVANDSVASMGAGGLVLQRTDGIVMRSEDLFISAAEIRVRYAFLNRTAADISTIVAFPLPDIVGGGEGDVALSDPADLRFTTTVAGVPVATEVEQKAMKDGVDHTALLRGLGVPLSPYADTVRHVLSALPRDRIDRLISLGLIEDRGYADSLETYVDFAPLWTLKTTHYWTQVFPAGRELDVDHRYVPATGGSAGSAFGDPELMESEWFNETATTYCADDAFADAARRKRDRGEYLTETWIDYVLTTGANWAEPIGDFRVVVDKGDPANLVSFCGEGVRRISPTRFEMRRRNFTPDHDLAVLILTGAPLD